MIVIIADTIVCRRKTLNFEQKEKESVKIDDKMRLKFKLIIVR